MALGATVYTCSWEEQELGECLKEWGARGLPVIGSVCDVSLHDQRERLIHDVTTHFGGKLDILVRTIMSIEFHILQSSIFFPILDGLDQHELYI